MNWEFNSNKLQLIKCNSDSMTWKKSYNTDDHSRTIFVGSKYYGFPNIKKDCFEVYDKTSFWCNKTSFNIEYSIGRYSGVFFYIWIYGMAISIDDKNEVTLLCRATNRKYCLLVHDVTENKQE